MAIEKELLGKAIRQVRQFRGMSQAALGTAAGLRGNSVALIERGERGVSMETLNELADALDVPAACLAMLGTSKIGGQSDSASLVKSMQKLIAATIVAQARIEAEESAEKVKRKHIQEAIRSIPEIEALVHKIAGSEKRAVPKKSPAKQRAL